MTKCTVGFETSRINTCRKNSNMKHLQDIFFLWKEVINENFFQEKKSLGDKIYSVQATED